VHSGTEAVRLLNEGASDLFSYQYTEPDEALQTVSLPRCSSCSFICLQPEQEERGFGKRSKWLPKM